MKHLMSIYTILIGVLLTFIINTGYAIDIPGTWQLDWSQTYNAMSQVEKDKFDGLPEQAKARITRSFSTRSFTFSQNGSVNIQWQGVDGPSSESGSWTISGNELTLVVGSSSKTYSISGDNSKIYLSVEGSANSIFTTLVLTRQ